MVRFRIGLPIIMQLILTYVVYRQNKENKIIKLFLIAGLIYTVACIVLALYELYYTVPNFEGEYIIALLMAQVFYQLALSLLVFLCLVTKKVNKKIAIEAILMPLISIGLFMLITTIFIHVDWLKGMGFLLMPIIFFFNIFNPSLIYILSYSTKGELFENTTINL